jgi:hypothetical protein
MRTGSWAEKRKLIHPVPDSSPAKQVLTPQENHARLCEESKSQFELAGRRIDGQRVWEGRKERSCRKGS